MHPKKCMWGSVFVSKHQIVVYEDATNKEICRRVGTKIQSKYRALLDRADKFRFWWVPDDPSAVRWMWDVGLKGATAFEYRPYPLEWEEKNREAPAAYYDGWIRWAIESPIPRRSYDGYIIPCLPEKWIFESHPPYVDTCAVCGRPMMRTGQKREYCSPKCKNEAFVQKRRDSLRDIRTTAISGRECAICGKPLPASMRKDAVICPDHTHAERKAYYRQRKKG